SRALALAFGSLLAAVCVAQPAQQGQPLTSAQIADGGDVTFRVRAPNASRVALTSGGDIPGLAFGGGAELTKGDDGVFMVTLEDLPAGAYRYHFDIDGVPTL